MGAEVPVLFAGAVYPGEDRMRGRVKRHSQGCADIFPVRCLPGNPRSFSHLGAWVDRFVFAQRLADLDAKSPLRTRFGGRSGKGKPGQQRKAGQQEAAQHRLQIGIRDSHVQCSQPLL